LATLADSGRQRPRYLASPAPKPRNVKDYRGLEVLRKVGEMMRWEPRANPAPDCGVAVGRQSDRVALLSRSDRAGADQLAAPLGPDTIAAGEDPYRAGRVVVGEPAHDGGVDGVTCAG
jgi:hypothetical protein